jgi:predicted aconitase/predicted aconitase with swiveling domain
MSDLELDRRDQQRFDGAEGPALQLAMELIVKAAAVLGARRLIPVSFAHLDSCFYAGAAHVDFAQFLVDHGARLAIPSWTNSGLVSLADTDPVREAHDPETAAGARRLMALYEMLGAKPVWTCAPYQLPGGPEFGAQIVASESNAVAYYNAVVGARTNKYGDYLDVACALVGKAPDAGLHRDEARRGEMLFRIADDVPLRFRRENIFHHLLGHHVGIEAGRRIPVIDGLDRHAKPEDLKAVSAAVAAAGGVEHWHGIRVTPEAPTLDAAFGGRSPSAVHMVDAAALVEARDALSPAGDGPLDMVALGTPHFGIGEFAALARLLEGRRIHSGLSLVVSTSRIIEALAAEQGHLAVIERAGVKVMTDSCSYYGPPVTGAKGRVMTNAAKWAYYAPGLIGVGVCFGSLSECVESAVRGTVWRDPELWQGMGGVPGAPAVAAGNAPIKPARRSGVARASLGRIIGRPLESGAAAGSVVVLDQPLSFWGGFDPRTGRIIDRRHPQSGVSLAGRIVLMRESRGSGTAPGSLAEAIRLGTAPAAIVLVTPDLNLAIGAAVGRRLYGRGLPVVTVKDDELDALGESRELAIGADGVITAKAASD